MTNPCTPTTGSALNKSMRVAPATGARKSLVRSQAPKKVLVVHPVDREGMSLIKIFRGCGYQMECRAELATAFGALDDISVVMCAASLADGSWRDLLARLGLIAHPLLVILTSRVAVAASGRRS